MLNIAISQKKLDLTRVLEILKSEVPKYDVICMPDGEKIMCLAKDVPDVRPILTAYIDKFGMRYVNILVDAPLDLRGFTVEKDMEVFKDFLKILDVNVLAYRKEHSPINSEAVSA